MFDMSRERITLFFVVSREMDPRASSGKILRVKSRYPESFRFLGLWGFPYLPTLVSPLMHYRTPWRSNHRDLWHLRHWFQNCTWIHDNLCHLTINCDTSIPNSWYVFFRFSWYGSSLKTNWVSYSQARCWRSLVRIGCNNMKYWEPIFSTFCLNFCAPCSQSEIK